MSSFSSSQFISTLAGGKDWREAVKNVWEKLEAAEVKDNGYNLGFLYITDHLSKDAASILNLLKSLTGIGQWCGTVGMGVAGCGEAILDQGGISIMLARFEEGDYCPFSLGSDDESENMDALQLWLKDNMSMLVLAHGDPEADFDLIDAAQEVGSITQGFVVGGMSSSRKAHVQFAPDLKTKSLSGVCFSANVKVASEMSQGCREIGDVHVVTKCDSGHIYELDDQNAIEVFEADLRQMTIKMLDFDPDEIMVDEHDIPDEYKALFSGEVHVGQYISTSDRGDYIVRHIIGADADEGCLKVASSFSTGDRIGFVRRDSKILIEDVTARLVALRERVLKEEGGYYPKGALYISCLGRSRGADHALLQEEISIVREVLGDIPLTGYYAGGEIYNGRMHGYSALIVLFL
ncbi:MAG: FIST C-terminal domain-containing protein [Micavibrio sp.]|nr:FIST C-terminal domain-containing protein [Micavibrio sp.]